MQKREFPPPYVSSGDQSVDRLAFLHVLERLKVMYHYLSQIHTDQYITDPKTHWLAEQ